MEIPKKPQPKYRCPITQLCSTKQQHRRCLGVDCGRYPPPHCWDCCTSCQNMCEGPSTKPEDNWVAPEEDAAA